jgi:hypothetical protein
MNPDKTKPTTVEAAVDWLMDTLSDQSKNEIAHGAGADTAWANVRAFKEGMVRWLVHGLGLGEGQARNEPLLDSCGTLDSEEAVGVVVRALWKRLKKVGSESGQH